MSVTVSSCTSCDEPSTISLEKIVSPFRCSFRLELTFVAAVSTLEFVDSLFNILTFFQTSAFVGNMIIGAGVVSLLVDFVKNQRRDRIPVVTRSIVFLDSLMYGYSSAFTLFGTAGGLAIFVERVKVSLFPSSCCALLLTLRAGRD